MNIHFRFTHLSDQDKEKAETYAREKFQHIEKFLSTFQEDEKDLHVSIDYHEKHHEYELKCTLQLGGSRLHHEEHTHEVTEGIDRAEANLLRQTKKHIEHLRDRGMKERDPEAEEETVVNYDNIA